MSTKDDNQKQLIDLICRLDESVDSDEDCQHVLHESSGELNPEQQEELRRAGSALEFFKGVRCNITAMQLLEEHFSVDESAAVAHDSTIDKSRTTKPHAGRELTGTLGRFEILDVLGQGGFSRVFLARDPQLDRLIALKVPRPGALARDSDRRRFQREAQAAAVLSHPAIVPIFETGAIGPISYIAFAYCQGETLAEWIDRNRRHPMPRVAATIVAELAEAVEHAHQRGVIHRDLKPGNVLLERVDETQTDETTDDTTAQRVRIADFGLAKYETVQDDTITIEGSVVGTPAYMSPEQARGDKTITAATDIYALGTILYELLTEQLPFKKETHLLTMRAVESEDPVPPRRVRPTVPRDLEAICMKCLEKRPLDRYPSAHDLHRDLQRFLDGHTIGARPANSVEKVSRWAKRNPALAAAVMTALLSMAIGLATTGWQWSKAVANLAESNAQRQRAENHLASAQDAIDRLLNSLANDETVPTKLKNRLVREAAEVQQRLLDQESEDPRVMLRTASAYARLAELFYSMGDYEQTAAVVETGLALLDKIDPELVADEGKETVFLLTDRKQQLLASRGIVSQSNAGDSSSEDSGRRQDGDDTSAEQDEMAVLRSIAQKRGQSKAVMLSGDYERAEEMMLECVAQLDDSRITGDNADFLRSLIRHQLSNNFLYQGMLPEAHEEAVLACELGEQAMIATTPFKDNFAYQAGRCMNHLGETHFRQRNLAQAHAQFKRAQLLFDELVRGFPESSHHVSGLLTSMARIAKVKVAQEDWQGTLDYLEPAIEFCDEIPPVMQKRHGVGLQVAQVHVRAAEAMLELNRPEEAMAAYTQAAARFLLTDDGEGGPGKKQYQLALIYIDHANALAKHGPLDQAEEIARSAVANASIASESRPGDAVFAKPLISAFGSLAKVHATMGKRETAIGDVNELLNALPPEAKLSVHAARILVECREVTSDPDDQDAYAGRAVQLLQEAVDQGMEVESIEDDGDFKPLRGRKGFQLLLGEASD